MRRAGQAAACLLLAGCIPIPPETAQDRQGAPMPQAVELAAVPFFPQEIHACGPAALAELLGHDGVAVSPGQLADEVYLPGREGTLAPELVAAVRRHGLLPEILPARSAAVLRAVAAGRPVLVLQNLGLTLLPLWHYAVVIGYDRGSQEVLLRSGLERRQVMSRFTFEQTWLRGGGFAMTALRPGDPPLYAERESWLRTLGEAHAAPQAWELAVRRWPDAAEPAFGLANARLALPQPDLAGAEQALRDGLRADPGFLPAYNNLALVLARQGNWSEARRWIDQGIARIGDPPVDAAAAALLPAFEDTRRQLQAMRLAP